ncbi:uncharacterized protein TM35_000052650 [Trypanosoma theileri]|uniref:Uncharacterized protein n=1 Tax=Trypanosoma theileri TaxID=67003 RepID=A0A1X0P545_9TRYP|nr:uncharacterized protein TM35_000052650 [Trypanosoma theileri]ORC91669.1 hypothetical protein TM35_000052650 [Trypanosoma theileri]
MLRRCPLTLCIVQYAALSTAASKLNTMLDIKTNGRPVSSDVLKQFIRADVMPLLKGKVLDRRHDSSEVRRFMGQLLRDAAFAAVVLHAKSSGVYVNTLVDCIKHDHERIQFVQKMTSSQASRVIDYLSRVGVRDAGVYAPLAARLDFNQLKEISRAMFALAEEGMYQEVVSFILPLYCGETWEPVFGGGEGYTGLYNKNSNVFDAVRLLRVLSKVVRGVVEQQRLNQKVGNIQPLPVESIQRLRTNLTVFILENKDLLRGGHWINFTRAMVYFPQEYKNMKYLDQHLTIVKLVETLQLPHRSALQGLSETIETDDMAALGMHQIFTNAEKREKERHAQVSSTEEKKKSFLFDVPSIDLTKLLSIINDVPFPKAIQQRRLELVIRAIVEEVDSLNFTDCVRFLQALRQIEGSAIFAPSLNAVVAAIDKQLSNGMKKPSHFIPYKRLVQFATLISAFRVKSCAGFSLYLSQFLPTVHSITVEDATALMNALASVGEMDGIEHCAKVGEEILEKVGCEDETIEGNQALLLLYPVACAKLLRASVLLNAIPSRNAITNIFGTSDEVLKVSPAFRAAGASVIFDVARSLYHFCRSQSMDNINNNDNNNNNNNNNSWETLLWKKGMINALLPLLTQLTSELAEEMESTNNGFKQTNTYVPLAWRSSIEAIFHWIDVNLDIVSLITMYQRIEDVYPFCRKIITMGVGIAEMQRRSMEENSISTRKGKRTAEPPVFSSNSIIHITFFLLILEQIIYHGTWQAEIAGSTEVGKEIKLKMQALKEDYNSLLSTPISTHTHMNKDVSPLTFMEKVFPAENGDCTHPPLFNRNSILEITTNLPFAISLVVSQGPINALFCERAVVSMIGVDNWDKNTESNSEIDKGGSRLD